MPRTKEQNKAIREERKQSIMDAALHLFAENGYEGTTTASIAKHANISHGLIFKYFESKDDLLHQILISGSKSFLNNLFPEMTMNDLLTNMDNYLDSIGENKHFLKLYYTLVLQQLKMMQNLGLSENELIPMQYLMNLFKKQFGEQALEEFLLLSAISQGFTILSLVFGDQKDLFPIDTLKNVVLKFIRERYLLNENELINK